MSEAPTTHSPDPDAVPPAETPTSEESAAFRAERDRLQSQLLRAQADYQNLKRRTASDADEKVKRALSGLFEQVFLALDNLELALATPDGKADTPFARGIRLTHEKLLRGLELAGVQRIAESDKLDPSRQEAVATEARDDVEPGTVLGLLRAGYAFQGQVIRPAQVRVATPGASSAAKPSENDEAR